MRQPFVRFGSPDGVMAVYRLVHSHEDMRQVSAQRISALLDSCFENDWKAFREENPDLS